MSRPSTTLQPAAGAAPVAVVTPTPTPMEMAAILAAYEALWPRPVVAEPPSVAPPRWRFSGRWWTAPAVTRRRRQALKP